MLSIVAGVTGILSGRVRTADGPEVFWYDMIGYPIESEHQKKEDFEKRCGGTYSSGSSCL